jgi:hypothetical protein
MSFTFVVEDGTMPAGANSYVSLDFANTYLEANTFAYTPWSALTDQEKQLLLVWSSRYLDQRATWNGIPTSVFLANPYQANVIAGFVSTPALEPVPTQPMRWPRADAFDVDNVPIPYDVIPIQLQNATCEMARYLITQDRSLERPQDGIKELKLDTMTLIFRDNYVLPIVPSEISYIIRGIGTISSGTTNFSKVRRA